MPLDVEFIGMLHDIYSKGITNNLYRAYTIVPVAEKHFHEIQVYKIISHQEIIILQKFLFLKYIMNHIEKSHILK